MFGDKVRALVAEACPKGEKHLFTFYAINPPAMWVALLTMGALYALFLKYYWVGVSDKSVYFLRLNLAGKVAQTDVFKFKEIESLKVTNSLLQKVAVFGFANGRKLVLNFNKFRDGGADKMLEYLQKKIA